MPITTNPLNLNNRTSLSAAKLANASELQLPSLAAPLPVPTEKVSLRSSAQALSDAQLAEIASLKARDSKVRQHEQAHLAAGAGLNVAKAALTYQRGPDGVQYAVGGDVRIDTTAGRTAADSLVRADMIIDVALAPADPTPSDRSAASAGQNMAQQARAALLQQAHPAREADTHGKAGQQHSLSEAYDSIPPARKKIDTFA